MNGREFFQTVMEASPFRQGDIIRRNPSTAASPPDWGVIITADCDIAHGKAGEHLSYLSVLTANQFLSSIWAPEELAKIGRKYGELALNQIHAVHKKHNSNASRLTRLELADWLREDNAQTILEAISRLDTPSKELEKALTFLELTDRSKDDALARLQTCWRLDEKKEAERRGTIKTALNPRQMRTEFMLLPALPSERELGFVVILRDIRTIRSNDLYPSLVDLRVAGGSADCMHRVGRFNDAIRYAVAQRMANLFSRIGMTETFENECEVAGSLVADGFLSDSDGGQQCR